MRFFIIMACIFCKSKYHDYRSCPAIYKLQAKKELSTTLKQDYFGKAPNVFVGKHGYPNIRVGILGTEQYTKHDDPLRWTREGLQIPEIIRLRSELINSHFTTAIKGSSNRFFDITKEVSLAKRPVDVEIGLDKKPELRMTFNTMEQPHGPTVGLKTARITENVAIDTRVDKATSANDLTASDAVTSLMKKGVDEHFLTKAFSMGNFGIPLERKLVPTRWSITAVDDITGKQKIAELKKCNVSDCMAYFGSHLGNYYLILCFDDTWQYELFEQFVPASRKNDSEVMIETDYEPYEGRKAYVEETAGGYFACRIAVLEKLLEHRKQASVLSIRIITEEYSAPLGVWVVREASRNAMMSAPLRFADRNLMLTYAKKIMMAKFGYDITPLLSRSKLVKALFGQQKLTNF